MSLVSLLYVLGLASLTSPSSRSLRELGQACVLHLPRLIGHDPVYPPRSDVPPLLPLLSFPLARSYPLPGTLSPIIVNTFPLSVGHEWSEDCHVVETSSHASIATAVMGK